MLGRTGDFGVSEEENSSQDSDWRLNLVQEAKPEGRLALVLRVPGSLQPFGRQHGSWRVPWACEGLGVPACSCS